MAHLKRKRKEKAKNLINSIAGNILVVIFTLIGLIAPPVLFYGSWSTHREFQDFKKDALTTQGIVLERSDTCGRSSTFEVTYRYTVLIPNGVEKTLTAEAEIVHSCNLFREFEVNNVVEVRYLPKSPEISRLAKNNFNHVDLFLGGVLTSFCFLLPVLFGAFYWLKHKFIRKFGD